MVDSFNIDTLSKEQTNIPLSPDITAGIYFGATICENNNLTLFIVETIDAAIFKWSYLIYSYTPLFISRLKRSA